MSAYAIVRAAFQTQNPPVSSNKQGQTESGGNLSDVEATHNSLDTGSDNTRSHVNGNGDETDTECDVQLLAQRPVLRVGRVI
jgi:hypothetical protein